MLTPKHTWSIVAIVILISIAAFFLYSHRKEQAPVIIYKTTSYLPRTVPQETSPSTLDSEVDRGATSTPQESTASASPKTEDALDSIETDDFWDDVFFDEMFDEPQTTAAVNEDSEEVAVSPHGFGAYPEVPSDYFRTPVWAYPDSEFSRGHELIDRVLIKLWKQGIYSNGGSIENGRVYPIRRGAVYVKWTGDFISDYIGHPDDNDEQIISILEDKGTPPGITVLDYDTAGIDPYQFLNL